MNLLDEALPPLSHAFVSINPPSHDPSSEGKLFLLPAGSRGSDRFNRYAEAVQSFDWTDFYTNFEGEAYFEWMRRQLESPDVADIVLIDSRTGVAEMSGVCTRQLADVVVCLCAPNDQNLDGIEMMAKSFLRPDLLEARNGRPLQLIMTPARIDISDGRPVDISAFLISRSMRIQNELLSEIPKGSRRFRRHILHWPRILRCSRPLIAL